MTAETRYYKLEAFTHWNGIEEVNEMILSGTSPQKVVTWCSNHGFDISRQKMYEYKQLLQTSIAQSVTINTLIGVEKPVNHTPRIMKALGASKCKELVTNEMDVLDAIIQVGFNTLKISEDGVTPSDAMRAIELKNKLTNGEHGGLTEYGLMQLRAVEQAKIEALTKVVMKYLPEDKYNEIQEAMSAAEQDFYKEHAPELLEEYQATMEEEIDKQSDKEDES